MAAADLWHDIGSTWAKGSLQPLIGGLRPRIGESHGRLDAGRTETLATAAGSAVRLNWQSASRHRTMPVAINNPTHSESDATPFRITTPSVAVGPKGSVRQVRHGVGTQRCCEARPARIGANWYTRFVDATADEPMHASDWIAGQGV